MYNHVNSQTMKDMYMETCMIYDAYKPPPKTQKIPWNPPKNGGLERWCSCSKGLTEFKFQPLVVQKGVMIREAPGIWFSCFSSKEVEVTWITQDCNMFDECIFVTLLIAHDLNQITFWTPPSAWSSGIHSFIPLPVSFDVVTFSRPNQVA